MNEHTFVLETDVLEIAGSDALQKLGERGNQIFLDFDEIEKRASMGQNDKYSGQLKEVLEYVNNYGELDLENKRYKMPSGGYILLDFPKNQNIVHLTRDPSIKSKLKRDGKIYEEPTFLTYGTDLLNRGIVNLNSTSEFNLNPEKITLDSIVDELEYEPTNNTIIRINGTGFIYRVEYPLIANSDNSRFQIDEEKCYIRRIFSEEISPLFSDFKLRTLEQKLAYMSLIDKNIESMIVSGGSGSGKTILSYVAAVEQILGNEKERRSGEIFDGILLFKSNDIIGGKNREQGFLPGSAYQKVKHFMKSYEDAHKLSGMNKDLPFSDMLADPSDENDEFGVRKISKIANKYLPARERAIEIEHLQYARGRTFENKLLIVDEVQNYSPFEIKQLIERVGVGSKIILVGDPEQIDNPHLDINYNGLVYAASIFNDSHPRYTSVYLGKNYRSQSAEIMRGVKAPLE